MIPLKPFYMIRHGETEANAAQVMSGHDDTILTPLGVAQAQAAAKIAALLDPKPSIIVHSFLTRTHETARYLNAHLSLELAENRNWAEQHFGEWQGRSYEDTRALIRSGVTPPGGETRDMFHARIKLALSESLAAHDFPLIISHGGCFRAFAGLYGLKVTGIPNCVLHEFTPDPANKEFPWKVWEFEQETGAKGLSAKFHGI